MRYSHLIPIKNFHKPNKKSYSTLGVENDVSARPPNLMSAFVSP